MLTRMVMMQHRKQTGLAGQATPRRRLHHHGDPQEQTHHPDGRPRDRATQIPSSEHHH